MGQVVTGRGHGGGWTLSSTAVAPNGINLMFDPPLSTGPNSPTLTQRLEVISLSPLRLMVTWTHRLLDRTADLTGQLELRLKVESIVCD